MGSIDSAIAFIVMPMFMYITADNLDLDLGVGAMASRQPPFKQMNNPTGHLNFTGYYDLPLVGKCNVKLAHTSDLIGHDDDAGINTITVYKTWRLK